MKKFLDNIILMACGAMLLTSCDNVSLDERLTYVELPEVKRAVLIEDYTGSTV